MIKGIKTKNIKPIVRKRMDKLVQKLKAKPEVEGIVYLSGLANTEYKDFIDEYSDIDIGIFLNVDREHLPNWLPPFSFYIVITDQDGFDKTMEVNFHQKIYDEEKNSQWHDYKKEFYKYACEIVFDRNGRIEKLINEKTVFTEEYRKLLLSHLLSRIYWMVEINPLNAVKRGLIFNGEDLLNQGLNYVTDLLYVYDKKFPPAAKWKISLLGDLDFCPNNIEKRIENCFVVNEISEEDVLRRRKEMLSITKEIENKVFEEGLFKSTEDYIEYEYKNWNAQQKQLKDITQYDIIVSKFNDISTEERKILKGILCEYFITNLEDLTKISTEELNEIQKNLLHKIIKKIN